MENNRHKLYIISKLYEIEDILTSLVIICLKKKYIYKEPLFIIRIKKEEINLIFKTSVDFFYH